MAKSRPPGPPSQQVRQGSDGDRASGAEVTGVLSQQRSTCFCMASSDGERQAGACFMPVCVSQVWMPNPKTAWLVSTLRKHRGPCQDLSRQLGGGGSWGGRGGSRIGTLR